MNSENSAFCGDGLWLFAILALFGFGGNGFFGGNRNCYGYPTDVASKEDVYNSVQRATDFQALERQNNEIIQNTSNVGAAINAAIKDGNYNLLGELRDVQNILSTGFGEMQKCCCETQRNIDSVRFDMANYSAATQAHTTAQVQKVLDALATNRMADMQNQINSLQLQNAMCGVVRYPSATTFNAGPIPIYNVGNGCDRSNI